MTKSIRKILHFVKDALGKNIQTPWELEVQLRKTPIQKSLGRPLYIVAYNNKRIFQDGFASSQIKVSEDILTFNNAQNQALPPIFNRFAQKHVMKDVWFVFCHQEFILKEDLATILSELDTRTIYGPLGIRMGDEELYGQVTQYDSYKVGRTLSKPILVHTLDDMCIIAHSSIFREGLTFDQKFRFHLYGADFCMSAYIAGFDVRVLPLNCQYKGRMLSYRTCSQSYEEAQLLFNEKWKEFLPINTTTAQMRRHVSINQ